MAPEESRASTDGSSKIRESMERLNNCFLSFKADPNENISSIVSVCGELLGATWALYNRFEEGMLYSVGQWNVPKDYRPVDKPEGHVCYDVIKQKGDNVLVIRNLGSSVYAKTDPNVTPHKLQTYVGAPVRFGDAHVGTLCVVYRTDFNPSDSDRRLLELFASAIGVEEARRRSELEMMESEEKLRAISGSATDAIVLMDDKGTVTYWNPAAERMFGLKKEEAIGQVAFKILAPKSLHDEYSVEFERFLKMGQRALDGRILDYVAAKKDGTEFPVELSISSLRTRGRQHVVTIIRDTTDRKRFEQVLREGEDKYRGISKKLESLMKSSAVMLHTTDLRQRLRTVAEAVREQGWRRVVISLRDEDLNTIDLVSAGLTPKEELYLKEHQSPGHLWRKRLSSMFERYRLGEFYYLPWSDPLVQEQFKYALTSKVKKHETVDWDPDDLLYVPLKLPDGQVVGIMSMDDPHDGRRPTTESLAPLELFAHQAAVAIENAKLIQQVKEYAQHLEEKVDERTAELRRSEEKLKSIFSASPDAIMATDMNGNIVECNEQTVKMQGYGNRRELIGTSFLEMIAQKDRQRASRNMKDALQSGRLRTEEYTFVTKEGYEIPVELSTSIVRNASSNPIGLVAVARDVTQRKSMEQQLFKSERLAAIGQLAAMVGHDLRNPLTGITGATYYLKNKLAKSANDRTIEMLEIIDKDVAYSNKIISDLLDYSREIKLELTESSPKAIMREVLSLVEIPRRVRVVDLTRQGPRVNVDVEKLKRAFINIIRNAVEAMPKGGKLTIRSIQSKDNLQVSFTDTGVGIPKAAMQKIFAPLFTSKAKGMGFGLAISKRIVEAHGGKISVKSAVGRGSTFAVIIPVKLRQYGGDKVWVNVPESLLSTMTKE